MWNVRVCVVANVPIHRLIYFLSLKQTNKSKMEGDLLNAKEELVRLQEAERLEREAFKAQQQVAEYCVCVWEYMRK